MSSTPTANTDAAMSDSPANTGMSAAAQAYQLAMQQQREAPSAASPVPESSKDMMMNDSTSELPASPAPLPLTSTNNAPSPLPQRTGTPIRANGNDISSRAASQHPDIASTMPAEAPPHGAPTRQYLNSKVTVALLDGMKQLAKEQPKDPLRVLGDYLLQRSKELEGS